MEPWRIRRDARLRAGLTQLAVAQSFNPPLSRVAVGNWERPVESGGNTPDPKHLPVLQRLYGLNAGQLLGQESQPPHHAAPGDGLSPVEKRLIDWYRRSGPAGRRRMEMEAELFSLQSEDPFAKAGLTNLQTSNEKNNLAPPGRLPKPRPR